ncbi:MAG: decaprenyl-phosphate phosphoribosyltransferase [Anaerolineaceae bacterium]|nr:decaprenyl-phosphate phosphoribosyltransferase [Anaerolineaceae bacterium]
MLIALIKSMRPRQWTKNGFVLAALIFDRQLGHPTALVRSIAGVILFCLLSGSVYLINDILDVESDRQHPTKRNRPIASGKLPIHAAIASAIIILLITFPAAYYLSFEFAVIALAYFLINLAYSKWLKHIPLLDVLILASGFVLRVGAGVSLIHVERFSPWLYVVTTLLALYIGFGKRRAELALLEGNAANHRRVLDGYTIPFLDQLITIVSGTTIVSYSFYTFSAPNVPANHTMMLTIPFVLYGIFRYLYLVQVKCMGGAPEELLLRDRPLQLSIALWGLSVLVVFYFFQG